MGVAITINLVWRNCKVSNFRKPSHDGTDIMYTVEEMPLSDPRISLLAVATAINAMCRKFRYVIQEDQSWRFNHYMRCGGNATNSADPLVTIATTINLVWSKYFYFIQENLSWL